jgi:hypothetical protein
LRVGVGVGACEYEERFCSWAVLRGQQGERLARPGEAASLHFVGRGGGPGEEGGGWSAMLCLRGRVCSELQVAVAGCSCRSAAGSSGGLRRWRSTGSLQSRGRVRLRGCGLGCVFGGLPGPSVIGPNLRLPARIGQEIGGPQHNQSARHRH